MFENSNNKKLKITFCYIIRLVYPEDDGRIHSSHGFNCRRQSRLTTHSSQELPSPCVFQEHNPIDYCRGRYPRDMEQHKRSYF